MSLWLRPQGLSGVPSRIVTPDAADILAGYLVPVGEVAIALRLRGASAPVEFQLRDANTDMPLNSRAAFTGVVLESETLVVACSRVQGTLPTGVSLDLFLYRDE